MKRASDPSNINLNANKHAKSTTTQHSNGVVTPAKMPSNTTSDSNLNTLDEVTKLIHTISVELTTKLFDAETKLKTLEATIANMQQKYDTQVQELTEQHRMEMQEFTDQNEEQMATFYTEKDNEIKMLREKSDAEIFDIKSELTLMRQERNELREKIKEGNNEHVETLNRKIGALEQSIANLRAHARKKEEQAKQMGDTVQQLQTVITQKDSELSALKLKTRTQDEKIAALNLEASKTAIMLSDAKKEDTVKTNKIKELQRDIERYNNRIATYKSTEESMDRTLKSSADLERVLNERITNLMKEIDDMTSDNTHQDNVIKDLQKQLAVLIEKDQAHQEFLNKNHNDASDAEPSE